MNSETSSFACVRATVTARLIARSSMTYRDFDTRCATAFGSQPLQMTLFIGALEGGQ